MSCSVCGDCGVFQRVGEKVGALLFVNVNVSSFVALRTGPDYSGG